MAERRYVIVGGGMAADAAAVSLHEADPSGQVTILSAEAHPPYSRPPLSKGLWKGDPVESIWRGTEKTGAKILLGRRGVSIDRDASTITDDKGDAHPYDALLIATGGSPAHLPAGAADAIYFRTFDDFEHLKHLSERSQRFAVIGGGFIGSEIAAALRLKGKDVVLMFPDEGIASRIFPKAISAHLVNYYREKGVDVRPGVKVSRVRSEGLRYIVTTSGGGQLAFDGVVAGLGIRPNIDLAHQAGLAVEDGIIVNDRLQTSDPKIYAAGDVARFPAAGLNRTMRAEHEDAALSMGRTAGQIMAGKDVKYTHLPFFYSDLFDLGYEAVGLVDSRLPTVARWRELFKEGIIYYTEGDRVRGVLLINTFGLIDKARQVIVEGLSVTKAGKLLATP